MTNRVNEEGIETDQNQPATIGRRSFVIATVATAAACACCGTGSALAQRPPKSKVTPGPVDVGTLADYSKDGVSVAFAKSKEILVIRNEGKLYASSSICTHNGCILELKNSVITCPCHKSVFSNYGTVTEGKAKSSLVRYAIGVKDGKVVADTTKSFKEKEWEDPASFIDVSKA